MSLGHFCGRGFSPPRISSTQRRVHINFVSDYSVAPNGFRMEWAVSGCGGDLRGKSSGVIRTPNYPDAYPLNVECSWRIRTPPGTAVQLNVTDFDFESSRSSAGRCLFDGLIVYGGPDATAPNLTQLCHRSTSHASVIATGNNMFLRFYSDSSIRGRGFSAEFSAKDGGEIEKSPCANITFLTLLDLFF